MTSKPGDRPVAIAAGAVPPRIRPAFYPAVLDARLGERVKRPLGDLFGLTNFGVNLSTLSPGAGSAMRHAHVLQDEFIYIVEGEPTLITDDGETLLSPGMCAGFKAGSGNAHHLINRSTRPVTYLEIGDRTANDLAIYPDDDLRMNIGADGSRRLTHKDGSPY